MKKFFYFMALMLTTVGFTACSDDEKDTASIISFATGSYSIGASVGDEVEVVINATKPVEKVTEVSFTASGADAANYTLSAEKFVINIGEKTASIKVTRAKATQNEQTLTLTLKADNGVQLGTVAYTAITFAGANVYTFTSDYDVLSDTREYTVELETAKGAEFSFAAAKDIAIEVAAGTTAVEGTNFEFPNGKVAKFQAGQSEGTVAVKFLKYEEGKDKLVLKIADSEGLYAGNFPTLTLAVTGAPNFAGEWQLKEFVPNNLKYLSEQMGCDVPVILDGEGSFKFEPIDGGYQFTPSFTGKLVNYFTAAGKALYQGVRVEKWADETGTMTMTTPKDITTYVFAIENVNYNVSATDKTIKNALVEFHFQTTDAGENQLIMSLIDYDPTEDTVAMGWGMTWKGVADLMKWSEYTVSPFESAPIRIAFVSK